MQTQKFKGDPLELQMERAALPAFERTGASLDQFYEGCFESEDFLLSLYDNGRMPFSERVPRNSFVPFFKQALTHFPVTGTFESYLFILRAVFGEGSGVLFNIPAPGKLEMLVNAATALEFDAQATEFGAGEFVAYDLTTSDGVTLSFRGLSGIDSEAELNQLLSELIPAGITPDVSLAFFALYDFVAEDSAENQDSIVDHFDNQIVFFET